LFFGPIGSPELGTSGGPAPPHHQRELDDLVQQRHPPAAVVGHPEAAATAPAACSPGLEPPLRGCPWSSPPARHPSPLPPEGSDLATPRLPSGQVRPQVEFAVLVFFVSSRGRAASPG